MELSRSAQWVGGLLFAAALCAPFAVRSVIVEGPATVAATGAGPESTNLAQTQPTVPFGNDTTVRVAAAPAPIAPPWTESGSRDLPVPMTVAAAGLAVPAAPPDLHDAPPAAPSPRLPDLQPFHGAALAGDGLRPTVAGRVADSPAHGGLGDGIVLAAQQDPASAAEAERALDLDRARRREIQLRLALMGHDPGIPDGVFGDLTRAAIRGAQAELSLPETGYLDPSFLARIETLTEEKLAEHRQADAQRIAAKQRRNADRLHAAATRNAPKCRRNSAGAIAENQGFSCDWALLEESLEALFGRGS